MKRSARKRTFLLIISTILIAIGAIGAYAFYEYNQLFHRMYRPLGEESTPQHIDTGTARKPSLSNELVIQKAMQPFTMLLIGIDTRGEEQSRSDSMFLTAVNPGKQSLALVPITRDIYVEVPGYGMEKMNHAMFYGGVPLLKQTIEKFFNIPIDRYVTIDFEGFKRLIDEIGGVEIDVKKRMKYYDPADGTNIDLQKGKQILNGENALYYARYRKSNIGRDDTDEERSARQIELIQAIMNQGKEKASIFRIFSFFDIAGDHIKTDLMKKEIERLVPAYKSFSTEQMKSTTITGEGKRLPYNDLSLYFYVVADEEKQRIKAYIMEALEDRNK